MRIYVDTSVFGGCFDPEFEFWSNRLIALFKIGKHNAVIEILQMKNKRKKIFDTVLMTREIRDTMYRQKTDPNF
ncbi:MAG: hypothetical protein WBP41_11065, partial [Saprospiraceae bacterium]